MTHQGSCHCGRIEFGFSTDPKGNATAAVNLRCLPDLDRSKLQIVPFDGRSR